MLKSCQKVKSVSSRHDDEEVKSSYLAIRRFTTLSTLSGHIIHLDHLRNTSAAGWFWKVRSCLLECFEMITFHCIVLAAILFPGHPYIESATTLSDMVVSLLMHNINACVA